MKNRISLDGCRPFSINNAYYKRTFTMTQECRIWRKTIIEAAKQPENLAIFEDVRNAFENAPKPAGLIVAISYGIRADYFFTKKGDVKRHSMDLSNVEKLLIDILFDPRFYERDELDNLNLDDKYIVKLYSEKIPKKEWTIKVEFGIINLEEHLEYFKKEGIL